MTRVRLVWENAYATEFDIQVSANGEDFTTVLPVTHAQGGTQVHDIRVNNQSVEAQFVRVFCKKRNTGYGASLWELEVYGEGLCDPIVTFVSRPEIEKNNYRKFIHNGQMYISRGGSVYTIDGRQCVFPQERRRPLHRRPALPDDP